LLLSSRSPLRSRADAAEFPIDGPISTGQSGSVCLRERRFEEAIDVLEAFIQSQRTILMLIVPAFILFVASSWWFPNAAGVDPSVIIQRSVEANQRDWAAAPQFNYCAKKKTDNGTRTYEELMIEGSRYEHLVAINDRALSPDRQADEAKDLQKAVSQRKRESADERRRRIAAYEASRKRDHVLMDEMAKAFRFTLTGEDDVDGRRVYVLHAVPKKGYKPPNRDAAVLTGMNGTLWIDEQTYQWVKVEAHVVHPVSIGGFAARVEPGTEFKLEKMPVAPGVWQPKHFAMKARARILFLFSHRQQEDDTFFNYGPAGERVTCGFALSTATGSASK
jgi:hypothetical protein